MFKNAASLLLLGIGLWTPGAAYGSIITWTNGHSYDVVFADNPTWFQARDAAAAMTLNGAPGYLATFVTRDEQEFVINHLGGDLNALWLGGYQDRSSPSYSEPYGGWKWITGEAWLGVAPNDTLLPRSDYGFNNFYFDGSSEEYTITWWNIGGINDYYHSPNPGLGDSNGGPARGFIVEFGAATVPEPSTFLVFSVTLGGMAGYACWRRRRAPAQDQPGLGI